MSESKHTLGPWRLYTDAKGRVSKIESKTGRVCTIQPGDKNRDANAALIARAPDLLRENEELERDVARHMKTIHKRDREIEVLTAQNAELLEALKEAREDLVAEALRCSVKTTNGEHDAATLAGQRVQDIHARMDAAISTAPEGYKHSHGADLLGTAERLAFVVGSVLDQMARDGQVDLFDILPDGDAGVASIHCEALTAIAKAKGGAV